MVTPRYTNKVQKDVKEILAEGLKVWFGVGEDVCPVLQGGQTPIQTASRYVAFHKLNSRQLGFQGKLLRTDDSPDTDFEVFENWVDEQTFQINCRSKETVSDTERSVTARDIAEGLLGWFGSWKGIEFIRGRRMATLRVSDIRDIVSQDESDLWQNTASFDLVFHIGQVKSIEHPAVTPRLKGIVGVPSERLGKVNVGIK